MSWVLIFEAIAGGDLPAAHSHVIFPSSLGVENRPMNALASNTRPAGRQAISANLEILIAIGKGMVEAKTAPLASPNLYSTLSSC